MKKLFALPLLLALAACSNPFADPFAKIDATIAAAEAELTAAPDSDAAHFAVGKAFYDFSRTAWAEGRDEKYRPETMRARAIDELGAAAALDPENPVFKFYLGNALAEDFKIAEARVQYEKALELAPSYLDARQNLAILLVRDATPTEPALAETELRKVLAADDSRAAAHYYLARALLGQNKFTEARTEALRAAALDPTRAAAIEEKLIADIDAAEQEAGHRG